MPNAPKPATSEAERLRALEQRLILMKETGPKSAAWQRARLATLWRIQQRRAALARATSTSPPAPAEAGGE